MRPTLEALGIRVIALSKDNVKDAATHKERDGLEMTLLADPELKVIRQYGVEHHKAINFKVGTFTIAGIPLTLVPPNFKSMAIPTSLLVDESGVIRWIDQSEDYRVRSDDARVRAAIDEVFGAAPATAA